MGVYMEELTKNPVHKFESINDKMQKETETLQLDQQ